MEKFPQQSIPETAPEKSPEELNLEQLRDAYAGAYAEYRKAFGGIKEKDLEGFEKTVEPARKFIEIGDSERLKDPTEIEAELRKQNFISALEEKGIRFGRANAIYEAELKKLEYDNTKEELGKKLTEQGIEKAEIFKRLILNERDLLNQAKIESWPPKEKNIFRKGMEWYMKRGTATRLLISTGLVTGVVVGAGGFGAAAAATYAGYRFVRGFGSVMIAKLAGKGVDVVMSRGIEAKKESTINQLKTSFDLKKLKETEKGLEKILEETAKKERRKLLIKGAVMATAGAGTAIGLGMLEQAWAGGGVKVVPETLKPKVPDEAVPEAPAKPGVVGPEEIRPGAQVEVPLETKPEILTIGERGPEGAIIDYFRENPEAATEKFGCPADLVKDGAIQDLDKFNEWAGAKAHLLWLEDSKEALAKPETLEQLQKLGYSTDAEGYTEMMHRIGKGAVEIDFESGKINLVDTEYLRARIPAEGLPKAPAEPILEQQVLTPEAQPLPPEQIALAEEKISQPAVEIPAAKSTEEIFAEVSPEIGREIITEKLYDDFGMWSGTYDQFSDMKLRDFFNLDSSSGYRMPGPPWEDYDYNKFSGLQNKMEKVYNILNPEEKDIVSKGTTENFIKKYFIKIFEGK